MTAKEFNELLRQNKVKIVCAESITAGLLASTIASVGGASDVLLGSIVTYSRLAKEKVLGVAPGIISQYTAESKETTYAMVEGLQALYSDADMYVAVTGVASTPINDQYVVKEPVGKIFVCIHYKGEFSEFAHQIEDINDRNEIRLASVDFIFNAIASIVN